MILVVAIRKKLAHSQNNDLHCIEQYFLIYRVVPSCAMQFSDAHVERGFSMYGSNHDQIVNTLIGNVRGGVAQYEFVGWKPNEIRDAVSKIENASTLSAARHPMVRTSNHVEFKAVPYENQSGVSAIFMYDVRRFTMSFVANGANAPMDRAAVGPATIVARAKNGDYYLIPTKK